MKFLFSLVLVIHVSLSYSMPWDQPDAILSAVQENSTTDTLQLRLVYQGDPSPAWKVFFDSASQEMKIQLAATSLKEGSVLLPSWMRSETQKDLDGSSLVVLSFESSQALSFQIQSKPSEIRMAFQDRREQNTSMWSKPWIWLGFVLIGIAGAVIIIQ